MAPGAGASTAVSFGLPEMMPTGSFSRSGSVVTVNSVEAHGLTTSDKIFVTGTGTASIDLAFVAVASVPNANRFTYTSTASGAVTARNGSYRKYGPGTFSRSGSTVTVTATNVGLLVVTGDIIATFVAAGSPMNVTNATITVTGTNTVAYTTRTPGPHPPPPASALPTDLYNLDATPTAP